MSKRITVTWKNDSTGTLKTEGLGLNISTTCWRDPNNKMKNGSYPGYATRMDEKDDDPDGGNRRAIWLGLKVPRESGGNSKEIFIHKGTSPTWSDGCIVIQESLVIQIWEAVPKNQREFQNPAYLQVVMQDEQPAESPEAPGEEQPKPPAGTQPGNGAPPTVGGPPPVGSPPPAAGGGSSWMPSVPKMPSSVGEAVDDFKQLFPGYFW